MSAQPSTSGTVLDYDDTVSFRGDGARSTEMRVKPEPISGFNIASNPSSLTNPSESVHGFVVRAGERPVEDRPNLLREPVPSVDAIVAQVTDQTVILNCYPASGPLEVSFPISLVPEELRQYGQPVRLSVGRDRGYRVPKIERRATFREVEPLPDLEDTKRWLDDL